MMTDTLNQLKKIRRDEEAIMNAEINAATAYSSTLGVDAQADFHKLHMRRVRRSTFVLQKRNKCSWTQETVSPILVV